MDEPNLSPELCRELAHFNPLGMIITPEEVRSWAFIIWPSFCDHKYPRPNVAIKKWWKNVSEKDIIQARERLQRMIDHREIAALEGHEDERPDNVIDFAAGVGRRAD